MRWLLLLALAGCLTPSQRREDTLIREARMFNDDLRWARWDAVASALPREEAARMQARASAVGDDLVMADYEVTGITFERGSEAARVSAKFDWYTRSQPTVRSTALEQRWEWRGGRWLMVEVRRTRGDRFPLVLEKMAAADAGALPTP